MVTILLLTCVTVNTSLFCGDVTHRASYTAPHMLTFEEMKYYSVTGFTQSEVISAASKTLYGDKSKKPSEKTGCYVRADSALYTSPEECYAIIKRSQR